MSQPAAQPAPSGVLRTIVLTCLLAFTALSVDIVLPILPMVARDFRVDAATAQLSVGVFVLGYAVCQLLYGPLSDRFGRRPLILIGMAIYFAASVGCLFAGTITELVIGRFAQAFGACAGPVLARAIVRDVYEPSAAARMLAELFEDLAAHGARPVLAGIERDSRNYKQLQASLKPGIVRDFSLLDEAIEWAEDQVIFRFGGFSQIADTALADQELLRGLSADDLAALAALCEARSYHPGERILAKGGKSDSIFFLLRGMVSVKLADGVRLATLVPGTAFGEMALIGGPRSADVFADNPVLCQRIPLDAFNDFRARHPAAAEIIIRNLAQVLAHRLLQANTKIDLLSAN